MATRSVRRGPYWEGTEELLSRLCPARPTLQCLQETTQLLPELVRVIADYMQHILLLMDNTDNLDDDATRHRCQTWSTARNGWEPVRRGGTLPCEFRCWTHHRAVAFVSGLRVYAPEWPMSVGLGRWEPQRQTWSTVANVGRMVPFPLAPPFVKEDSVLCMYSMQNDRGIQTCDRALLVPLCPSDSVSGLKREVDVPRPETDTCDCSCDVHRFGDHIEPGRDDLIHQLSATKFHWTGSCLDLDAPGAPGARGGGPRLHLVGLQLAGCTALCGRIVFSSCTALHDRSTRLEKGGETHLEGGWTAPHGATLLDRRLGSLPYEVVCFKVNRMMIVIAQCWDLVRTAYAYKLDTDTWMPSVAELLDIDTTGIAAIGDAIVFTGMGKFGGACIWPQADKHWPETDGTFYPTLLTLPSPNCSDVCLPLIL